MIASLWYVVYRAPTELCKVLRGCCVGFYALVVYFGLFSRSLEAMDCSADPWKFGPRSKLFGSLDHLLSSLIFHNWDPRTSGISILCIGTKDSKSFADVKILV